MKRYWVVFLNDWPLAVCTSEEQADREVALRKAAERARQNEAHAGRLDKVASEMNRLYYHWHDVPASEFA